MNQEVSLTLHNVSLRNCDFQFHRLKIKMFGSEVTNCTIKVFGTTSVLPRMNETNHDAFNFVFNNSKLVGESSTVLNVHIFRAAALFYHSVIVGATQHNPAVLATNQALTIFVECKAANNSVSNYSAIAIFDSYIKIKNCVFSKNAGIYGGALFASKNASVFVENSTVEFNQAVSGGSIYVDNFVDVSIDYSIFNQNWCDKTGGAIFGSNNSHVQILHTNFTKNRAQVCGCILLRSDCQLVVQASSFRNNFADTTGVLCAFQGTSIQIRRSDFVGNSVVFENGVFRMENDGTLAFAFCSFSDNRAGYSAGVGSVDGDIQMTVNGCLFDNNTSLVTGILNALGEPKIVVDNSTFTKNEGKEICLMYIFEGSFSVHNSQFYENRGRRIVCTIRKTNLFFENCTFSNHSLAGGAMIVAVRSQLTITGCFFRNNSQINDAGVVSAQHQSIVNVTSSVFISTRASNGGVFHLLTDSALFLQNSRFVNNSGFDGGVAFLAKSSVSASNCTFINCTSDCNGGVFTGLSSSDIFVGDSTFMSNKAVFGGCFSVKDHSTIEIQRSFFDNNAARQGGVLRTKYSGNVTLENCIISGNSGAVYISKTEILRLSGGSCFQSKSRGECIQFECNGFAPKQCRFYTMNYTVSNNKEKFNSVKGEQFFHQTKYHGMIRSDDETGESWLETPFASGKFQLRAFCDFTQDCVSRADAERTSGT